MHQRKPVKAGRCPELTALTGSTGMSVGVRARQMNIVNGNREFDARLVIVEQSELISLLARRRIKISQIYFCTKYFAPVPNTQGTPGSAYHRMDTL
jgi:hypothetical protein